MIDFRSAAALIALSGCAGIASAQTVSGQTVLNEGDALAGSLVSGVGAPFTDGNGKVGFVVNLEDGRRAIWYDTGTVFLSDSIPGVTLSGGEGTMGIGNNGEFVYSPSIDGGDGLVSQSGPFAFDDAPAFDAPAGFNNTFHSRPTMTDDGTIYWVSGLNDGMGGTSSQSRILYQRLPDGTTTGLIRAGDMIDGATVGPGSGVSFNYGISSDNSQRVFVFNDANAGGGLSDGTVSVNGTIVAREGSPNGSGDNWDNFDQVPINNMGNYLITGDTDGATTTDEFIAYNGAIVLREGDALAGGILDGSVDAASINNLNEAAFIWELDSGMGAVESLFFASDASNLASTSEVLLSVGDGYDETGDGIADWIIDDFNASAGIGPGLELAGDGFIFVEVDLISPAGGDSFEAIIRLAVPSPGTASLLALAGLGAMRRRR